MVALLGFGSIPLSSQLALESLHLLLWEKRKSNEGAISVGLFSLRSCLGLLTCGEVWEKTTSTWGLPQIYLFYVRVCDLCDPRLCSLTREKVAVLLFLLTCPGTRSVRSSLTKTCAPWTWLSPSCSAISGTGPSGKKERAMLSKVVFVDHKLLQESNVSKS